MRTRAASFLAVVLALANLARLNAGKEKPPAAADYCPLKVGSKWNYKVGEEGKLTTQVVKHETIDGARMARLESSMMGRVFGSEHLWGTEKELLRYRTSWGEAAPPVILLKVPYEKERIWKQDIMLSKLPYEKGELSKQNILLRKDKATVIGKMGEETVKVPAGKYKAVIVELEMVTMGKKFKTTYWFAAGVGIVKQAFNLGGEVITLELESFELAK